MPPPPLVDDLIGEVPLRLPPDDPACLVCASRPLPARSIGQSSEMPPPPPPPLVDDLIGELLLRLPPDDPACLVRASLVCKPWRRLLTDRGFLRRYRAFHRTPPVLGFLDRDYSNGGAGFFLRFVPTAQPSPISQSPPAGRALDCRHGRVLLQVPPYSFRSGFTVWDPITGGKQHAPPPVDLDDYFTAAVLCASDGCDHLECQGGPFLVVVASTVDIDSDDDDDDDDGWITWVSVYSSETGAWSAPTSIELNSFVNISFPSLLAGGALYFIVEEEEGFLKYDLTGGALSVIQPPSLPELNFVLATADDGGLGIASVEGFSLHLWSCRNGPDGDVEWTQRRVIELDMMIPIAIGDPSTKLSVVGFAEDAGSVFINANDGLFTVELKSGRVRKIGKRLKRVDFYCVFPFASFYTLDHASARLQAPMRTK